MKFSEQWLRSYVNPVLNTEQLAHVLTMAGLEVEQVTSVAADFSGVVVARVCEVMPHPQADRLRVCQVDAGTGSLLQIVCGAPNVCLDAIVPCATVGAQLPGMQIKPAKLRGIESFGMLCSATELGLPAGSDGLLMLPTDAPIGMDLRDYLQLNDHAFTLKLTPNRSDCLGIVGIARDVGAMTGTQAKELPSVHVLMESNATVSIDVQASDACPYYAARVIEQLNPAVETPLWMRQRLERSGLRSLGAVVDITNYVLLETGQPLHAFDADCLFGGIQVRMATANESLLLLNGQTVDLSSDLLVIADQSGPQALAGIMGGSASAVSQTTTRIVLESAWFHPSAIAGRSRRLGLNTDAGYRFERGVDFGVTGTVLAYATQLLLDICGGKAGPVTECQATLPQRSPVRLRLERIERVLGICMTPDQIREHLIRLGMRIDEHTDAWLVTPPSWRFDIEREVDLIEELARLYGYERVPATIPIAPTQMLPVRETCRPITQLLRLLAARDYQEVVTYSFVDSTWEAEFSPTHTPIVLQNPIASQMAVMRSTLMGGLLDVLHTNLNRRQEQVRIVETGRCFLREGDGFTQPQRLGGLAFGPVRAEQWGESTRNVDFYDVKADLAALFHPMPIVTRAAEHPALHPGQTAQVWVAGQRVGWLGTLHPAIVQRHGLPSAPVLFELDLTMVQIHPLATSGEISRFQQVRRDLAIVIDQSVSAQSLLDAMLAADVAYVTDIAVFDSYRGQHIAADKKSLAFRVLLQDNQKTLTDEEVEAAVASLTEMLQQQFGAQLRS